MSKNFILFAMIAALVACAPVSTSTPLPIPSPTQTNVAATVTFPPPTATNILPTPTSTRIPPTVTLTATPTRISNEPPPVAITLVLAPEPNLATVTFTARGSQTQIDLNIRSAVSDIAQSAIIYERTCAQLGIVRYTLANIVNGKSTTTLDVPLVGVLSGVFSLDIKKSTRPGDSSFACIGIPEVFLVQLDQGSQPGVAAAYERAGGLEIDAFIKPGPPGVPQPAFIREGTCSNLGEIRYSLEPIVDGVSKTFFGVTLSQFKREKGALNVHKSVQELGVSVACGVLVRPE